jgi:hypothetical protein
MGGKKKSSRLNGRQRHEAAKDNGPDETIEGLGFQMTRHGRFIETRINRSADEQRALVESMANHLPEAEEALKAQVNEIANSLRDRDTFQVLAALSLRNHLVDPETYSESSHEGKSVVVEFASLIALKSEYSRGTNSYDSAAEIAKLQASIEEVVTGSMLLNVARSASSSLGRGRAGEAPTLDEELQFIVRAFETGVRNLAYEHHHKEVLRGLFAPFDEDLRRLGGVTVDQAISLAAAIPERVTRRFVERARQAAGDYNSLEAEVRLYRKHPHGPRAERALERDDREGGERGEFLRKLASQPPKKIKQFLRYARVEWLLFVADTICCFSPEELQAEVPLPLETVQAFLDLFSISFPGVDPDFYEPSPTHVLRDRPLLAHDGRYLCPAMMLLDWAIQSQFERLLKQAGGALWQRYHKHRHDWVLNRALDCLSSQLPSGQRHQNLFYTAENGDQAELDGFVAYDSLAVFLEVKAADLTPPARRGAPERLRRELRTIIGKSHDQAVRAKGAWQKGAAFRDTEGGQVELGRDFSQVLLLSVSLAPVGVITARLHSDAEYFSPGEYSWLIGLYDLLVIADILDLPGSLPHYAKQRVETAHLGLLEAADELDIFGYYLVEGLYLDRIAEEMRAEGTPARFQLLSYTEQFDAYYAFTSGIRRKRAKKPRQEVPAALEQLIRRVDASSLPGRLDAIIAILDLDSESRKQLAKGVENARSIARSKRRPSNISLVGPERGGWGITYYCGLRDVNLRDELRAYCERKRDELSKRFWVGIAEVIELPFRVVEVVVLVHVNRPTGA